jgi:hypothetical protein
LSYKQQGGKDHQKGIGRRPNPGKKEEKKDQVDKKDIHLAKLNQDWKKENSKNQRNQKHYKTGIRQPVFIDVPDEVLKLSLGLHRQSIKDE